MHLRTARLCLDCDNVHETQQCPVCASEAVAFMTRWVPGLNDAVCQGCDRQLCGRGDRHTEKTMKRLVIAMSLSMSMWACGGGRPTTPTAAPSPAPASPFAVVTGNYELTIEIDDKCAQIPPTLRVRRYNATLEDRGWHFLPVNVVGGGFATPVLMADLWPPSPDGRWRLAWNSFDVGGCDYPEPLPESTELYVCADGAVTLSDSMLSGAMPGSAFVKGSGSEVRCTGSHRFTFVRKPEELYLYASKSPSFFNR